MLFLYLSVNNFSERFLRPCRFAAQLALGYKKKPPGNAGGCVDSGLSMKTV
jgi:hypothetical protein